MNNKFVLKHSLLASAIALAIPTSHAYAADQEASEGGLLEELVVTGFRGSLQRAIDIKRDAASFVDAISAEDVGKFPDQNVAESLQRIPGITIERQGGEGRFVSVRGFGKEHTAVLVNGRVLTTENEGREFSFDILASELISGAQIHKSPSARLQEGGIGATVNITTARPFDFIGFKAAGSLKGIYDDNAESTTPLVSGLVSNTFMDGKLGALVSFSYQKKDFLTNRAFTEGYAKGDLALDNGQTINDAYMSNWLALEANESTRERSGGSFALQFRPTDELELTLDGIYSKLDVDSDIRVVGMWNGHDSVGEATVDSNNTVTSFATRPGKGNIEFDTARRPRFAETKQIGFNADWGLSDQMTLTFDTSFSESKNEVAGNQNWFQATFPASSNRVLSVDWSGRSLPRFSSSEGLASEAIADSLRITSAIYEGVSVTDEVFQTNADIQYDFDNDGAVKTLYAGLTYSGRTKTKDTRKTPSSASSAVGGSSNILLPASLQDTTEGFFGSPFISFNGDEVGNYILSTEGRAGLSAEGAAAIAANGGGFGVVPNLGATGEVEEGSWAVYFQADLGGEISDMTWTGNLGLRYTGTDVLSSGFGVEVLEFRVIDPDAPLPELEAVTGDVTKLSEDGDYTVLLPSANFALNLTDELILRAAAAKTVTRPTLSDILYFVNYDLRPDNLFVNEGNPGLEPFEAKNYDIGLEWYFGEISYMSAAYFYKDFSNEIEEETDRKVVAGQNFERRRKVNKGEQTFEGYELAAQYAFSNIEGAPEILSGFGVSANYTHLSKDRSTSYNFGVFYEKGPLQARAAYSYRDNYIDDEFGSRGEERSIADFGQWDGSVSYAVTEDITIFVEGVNIGNEELKKYSVYENRVHETQDTGARYNFGVRAIF